MYNNQLYLQKTGDGGFIEETGTLIAALSGNLGIGTGTPGEIAKLHILGTSSQTDPGLGVTANGNFEVLVENSDTTLNNFAKLRFKAGTADSYIMGVNKGTNRSDLAFYTDDEVGVNHPKQRMVITTSGNVGIGTGAAAALLEVAGSTNPEIRITDTSPSSAAAATFRAENSSVTVGSYSDDPLYLVTNNSTKMTVTAAGNVGIGVTSTSDKLDVDGSIRGDKFGFRPDAAAATSLYYFDDFGGSNFIGHQSPAISLYSNGTKSMSWNNGRVGIGTGIVSPASALHMEGTETVNSRLTFAQTTAGLTGTIQQGSAGIGISALGPDNNLFLATAGVDHFILTSGGNVGIGTISPAGPLHVSNSDVNTLTLTREINTIGVPNGYAAKIEGGALDVASPSMGAALGFALVDVDGAGAAGNTQGYLYFETKDPGSSLSEKMRIDESGRVGIGTATPSATLEVQANNDSAGAYAFWVTDKTHTNSIITAFENGDVQLGNFFYNDTSGNVGIGTDSGSALLEVAGPSNPEIRITDTAPASAAAATFRAEDSSATIGAYSNDPLYLVTNNSTKMTVTAAGNVGIGVTSTSDKLDVDGSIRGDKFGFRADAGSTALYYFDDFGGSNFMGHQSPAIALYSNGTKSMSWNNGRVGIGTGVVSPAASLEIVNKSSTTSESFGLSVQGGGGSSELGYSFQALDLDGNTDFFVRGDGNIGIGTATPSGKLEIGGSGEGIVLNSPDGTKYLVTVDNAGNLTVT